MLWSIGYATAVACGILAASSPPASAFLTTPRRRTTALRSSYMGWDNDNFLDSLGKGDDAIRDANAEYDRLKVFGTQGGAGDFDPNDSPAAPALPNNGNPLADEGVGAGVPGASLTDEMKEKMKAAANSEDGSQGGRMFQDLLARAEQNRNMPPQPPPAPSINPQAGVASAMENLTVEQQAEIFRTMLSGGAAAPPGATPLTTPKSTAPQGTGPDGRKVGRNRDADAIVNTADVYFAQLKMDSNIRNRARQSGDYDKANQVFADPSISAVKMHVNPYTEEAKLKEKAMLETAADEMILPSMFTPEPEMDKSFAGVSYKDKLKQRKSKGSSAEQPTSPSAPPAMQAPPPPKEEVSPASTPQPMMEAPPAFQTSPPPAVFQTPPATAFSEPQAAGSDLRGDIRTLMGLLIKHRGGPGFGAGRLRGAEAERFETMARSVIEALRKEATPDSFQSMGSSTGPMESSSGQAFAPATTERVSSMISCIEGGIQFYKNAPPELKDNVILTLREVLMSALNTCNEVIAGNEMANAQAFQQQTASTPFAPETTPPPPPPAQSYDMAPAQQFPPPMDQFSAPVDQFAPPMDQFSPPMDQFPPSGGGASVPDSFPPVQPGSPEAFGSPFESGPPAVPREPNPVLAQPGDPFRRPSQSSPPVPEPPFDHFQKRSASQPPVAEEPLPFDPFQKPSQSSAFNPFQGPPSGSAPPAVEEPVPDAGVPEPESPFTAAGADKPQVENFAASPKVEEASTVVPPPSSTYTGAPVDENSQYLNTVYEKLQNVAGDGKMGLKKGLDADEARKLAEDLDEMKVRIVDELMEGVPEPKAEETAEPPAAPKGTASKYQEMLAKAKADKEAKN